ncbi:MAG TPA: DNA polymerase Y family protein [Nevskiaceae bacterium]
MLWACVLLPSLALDGVLRGQPPLMQPFALVHGSAQRRTLMAVNAAARARGLRPGQRLAEAQALCGELLTQPFDSRQRERDLELIAAWAYRYSADVLLDPPHALALEVGRSLRLFGPWPRLAAELRAGLAALGFHHRLAAAPNPCAARVLARARDGATAADDRQLRQLLRDVPVARAGLPREAAALPGMGIRFMGQLLDLPRAALERRFGPLLSRRIDALLGARPTGLRRYEPPEHFEARFELATEIHGVQALLFPLRRMLADLATFAAARGCGVQRFTLRFTHAQPPATELAVGLLSPEHRAAALFEVARLRLENFSLDQPVLEFAVRADALRPYTPPGTDLWDARSANPLQWEELVNRLRARLGEGAVHGLAADPDPRPERASLPDTADADTAVAAPASPAPRPTWLLPQPVPLSRPPARILAGPERLETGWWDGGDVRRDYYVVELPDGQRAWVYAPPGRRDGFMLHGWFA